MTKLKNTKVILALKKYQNDTGEPSFFGKLIKFYTKSNYYHAEIIIGNTWYSSNSDEGGVSIHQLRKLNNNYDYFEIKIDPEHISKGIQFLLSQRNASYDWTGILFSQFFKINIENRKKWFCSEIVCGTLKAMNEEKVKYLRCADIAPEDLYQLYGDNNEIYGDNEI
jgi:hypothetical protein